MLSLAEPDNDLDGEVCDKAPKSACGYDDGRDGPVSDQIDSRLNELQAEKAKGEEMLASLEAEVMELRSQLLRISGAIQVLQELSEEPPPEQ